MRSNAMGKKGFFIDKRTIDNKQDSVDDTFIFWINIRDNITTKIEDD